MSLVINPIAFSIGAINVRWYGIILATAALAGLVLAVREGRRFGIVPDFFMDLLLIGVPSAIVGARAYYVIFQWGEYKNDLVEIFKIWHGGIAIYGALIGALIGGFFYIRSKGYTFMRIVDICAPGLLIGQTIGRWGNFMNQEAHGGPVTEDFLRHTLHLPNFITDQMLIQGVYYHPTFLYESLWNLAGVLLLVFWLRRRPFLRSGELFFSYLIWYSIGRFFIEGVRTDSLAFTGPDWLVSLMKALWSPMNSLGFEEGNMAYGNVRTSQLLAVLLVLGSVALIIIRRKMGYAAERYSDPLVNRKRGSAAVEAEPAEAAKEAVEPAEPAKAEAAKEANAVELTELAEAEAEAPEPVKQAESAKAPGETAREADKETVAAAEPVEQAKTAELSEKAKAAEPAKAEVQEPTKAEPAKAEATKAEPAELAEPLKAEAAKAEPAKAEHKAAEDDGRREKDAP
jgi:phosphatidylglycerol:prolipoprotein diacylglycerol transferase